VTIDVIGQIGYAEEVNAYPSFAPSGWYIFLKSMLSSRSACIKRQLNSFKAEQNHNSNEEGARLHED